ncbi:peptidase S8/S53 subtilisin kexin sedolisin, partial [Paraburkholderia sp. SIMBA_030]
NVPGVTFVASSGDSGTGTEYPASSPYVVAVGGTTLSTDTSGNYIGEAAWSGSGGGVSTIEAEPAGQTGWPVPVAGKRGV